MFIAWAMQIRYVHNEVIAYAAFTAAAVVRKLCRFERSLNSQCEAVSHSVSQMPKQMTGLSSFRILIFVW
jgi:hypothetical protein